MSLRTAAKGLPLVLEDRLALISMKVFFFFPQTEVEISPPIKDVDTEAVSILIHISRYQECGLISPVDLGPQKISQQSHLSNPAATFTEVKL